MTIEDQPASQESELPPPSTPRVVSIDPDAAETFGQETWRSPAFFRSTPNAYGGLLGSQFDPFAEDDGFVPGKGRKRPRYSFQRDDWQVLEEPLSPQGPEEKDPWEESSWEKTAEQEENIQKETEPAAQIQSDGDELIPDAPDADLRDASQEQLPVFVKPSLETTGSMFGRRAPEASNTTTETIAADPQGTSHPAFNQPTDTPQLRPIPSPGLPIPSPITSGHNHQGYFTGFHTASQSQDVQPITSAFAAYESAPGVVFHEQLSPVSQPQAAPDIGEDEQDVHQDEATIFSPSALAIHHSPPASVLETQFTEMSGMPAEASEPPELMHEDVNETELPVEHTVAGQAEAISNKADSESDADEDYGEDIDDRVGVPEETKVSDSEEVDGEDSDDNVDDGELYRRTHTHPTLFTEAQAAIEVGGFADEQQEHAPDDAESQDEASDANQIPEPPGRLRSPDDSENESGEDTLDDEDAASDYVSQYDYDEEGDEEGDEEEAQAEEDSDDNSEEAKLPGPPPSQPEIIVLDSDSEDELASEQPTPSQPMRQENRRDRDSFIMSASADVEVEKNEDEWPDFQDKETAAEDPESLRQEDRVDDSDLEDESSVDVLAHDQYPGQELEAEGSAEEDSMDSFDESEEKSTAQSHGQGIEGDIRSETRAESIVDVDSDDDQAIQGNEDAQPQEFQGIQQKQDSSADIRRTYYVVDGADDRDQSQQPDHPSQEKQAEAEQETPYFEEASDQVQDDIEVGGPTFHDPPVTNVDLGPTKSTEQQLLTPDPTQEVVSDPKSVLSQDEAAVPPPPDSRTSPLGLSISFDEAQDAPDGRSELAEDDVTGILPDPNIEDTNHEAATIAIADSIENAASPRRLSGGKIFEHTTNPVLNLPAPDRHASGYRSKLAYFAPLATLIDHYNALVDTLSIVHESSAVARATSGSKDHYMTLQLTDPSMAGTSLQAQIFRRYESALPSVAVGDAILLRNFKVRSYDHAIMLVSVESSSWAVFDGSGHDAQVKGPPVEYGPEERGLASGLRRWFTESGARMVADNQLQASVEREEDMERGLTPETAAASEDGSMDSSMPSDMTPTARSLRRSRKSHRRVTIHELRDGRRYTEVGSPSTKESIHELRDGTVYANL